MSIRVRWYNDDQQILVAQFTSRWTWNEFFRAKATLDNMLDTINQPTHCIVMFPSDVILPPDSLRNGKHALETKHPLLEHIVVAKSNILIKTVYKMVLRQHPQVETFVTLTETKDHAVEFINSLSAT